MMPSLAAKAQARCEAGSANTERSLVSKAAAMLFKIYPMQLNYRQLEAIFALLGNSLLRVW
jgi:hypothetical protein